MRDANEIRTRRLYDGDAYASEFDAVVLAADGNDIVLDQTLFFPEEGGQCPDRGVLMKEGRQETAFSVTDVRIRDGEIHHLIRETGAFAAGDRVHGKIDWNFRFSNMQQHSGEHLFSGIVHRRYGFDNVGFHLSGKEVTLDFNGVIPGEDIPSIEEEIAEVIFADLPSEVRVTTPEEREKLSYRSKLDLPGDVRIVIYPGVDACACCAPHVRRTGEIGLLTVTGMINWKGGVRVSILCGMRAFRYLAEEHRILTRTARYLTTSPSEVYAQTVRLKEENRTLMSSLRETGEQLLLIKAGALPPEDDVVLFSTGTDQQTARGAVNAMMAERSGICAVFSGSDEEGYTFLIGSAHADTRVVCKKLREKLGAKGGGKKEMVEGKVHAKEEEIRAVFTAERSGNE
ncbi:MAG: alanyl-tRNA editing protein [Lachnospiraceae bacterium]|nr:alanyl-tRNA editing protein [Lachnospiraceae bacterium]